MSAGEASEAQESGDLRGAERVKPVCRAFFSSGRVDGAGTLVDLSANGARLDDVTSTLKPGTKVTLTLELKHDGFTIQIGGEVTRKTGTGFAVEFYLDPDPSVEQFMAWLIARANSGES
jgi:hypothetical protein